LKLRRFLGPPSFLFLLPLGVWLFVFDPVFRKVAIESWNR
jgi:hypothetical protein